MVSRQFTAQDIRDLLGKLDVELQRQGRAATIFVVGGAAMALAYRADRVTDDIDGIFEPRDVVLEAAAVVAVQNGLQKYWLSDGVSQLMPPVPDDHPRTERIGPALTLEVASPQYVLAMKAVASRQSAGDREDAATLCRLIGIRTQGQLEAVVNRYFPGGQFGAQELFFERIIDSI
ncbi:hypothetical protein B5P44_00410 [Mycobacterium sp. CBMA 213]|nr:MULTISPECIES: DUF6036 family nucleotidyltransferase [unclassified Mycolicibacterium]MUL61048.1 hypothetical protein [Mycolicibacterium sp. CBMA 335]MUM03285.1 hypothetical protein [Mycolicibacterium sp. CBMA 213]